MPEIDLEISPELEHFPEFANEAALKAAIPAMDDTLLFLHDAFPKYPAIPDGSSYGRTGTLGKEFTQESHREMKAVVGTLGTNLAYAPWVVGADFEGEQVNGRMMYQAKVHVDRWWQLGKVVDANLDEAWQEFEAAFWPEFKKNLGGASTSSASEGA